MRCPSCNEVAIAFRRWCCGVGVLRTRCRCCGETLRADRWVRLLFAVSLLCSLAAGALLAGMIVDGISTALFLAFDVAFGMALLTAFLAWLSGAYEPERVVAHQLRAGGFVHSGRHGSARP